MMANNCRKYLNRPKVAIPPKLQLPARKWGDVKRLATLGVLCNKIVAYLQSGPKIQYYLSNPYFRGEGRNPVLSFEPEKVRLLLVRQNCTRPNSCCLPALHFAATSLLLSLSTTALDPTFCLVAKGIIRSASLINLLEINGVKATFFVVGWRLTPKTWGDRRYEENIGLTSIGAAEQLVQ